MRRFPAGPVRATSGVDVVAAELITDVDPTAADMLEDLDEALNAKGISLVLAEMKDPVREMVERYELTRTIDPSHVFPTVGAAVAAFRGQFWPTGLLPPASRLDDLGALAEPVRTPHLVWGCRQNPKCEISMPSGDDGRPSCGREPQPSRREGPMASLFKRAKDFAQSPKGKQLTEEVKEQASKPENRRKVKELGQRFMKRR